MADITKLRSKADKGAPPMPEPPKTSKGELPPREQTNDNLSTPPRGKPVAKAKIKFSVPDDIDTLIEAGVVYADFREDLRREQAGRD